MRTRLFVITSLVVTAVLAGSAINAADAAPKGPGDISQAPATTTPPQGPKDKVAPKPTTSTTLPAPKGPDDLAPAPKGDDVADPTPAPTPPQAQPQPEPHAQTEAETETVEAVATQPAETESPAYPPLVLILAAAVAGALLALVVMRYRSV